MVNITCALCGGPINPNSRSTCWRIIGWEQKIGVRPSGKQAGSDIIHREPFGSEIAHRHCVDLVKAGISPQQTSLVDA